MKMQADKLKNRITHLVEFGSLSVSVVRGCYVIRVMKVKM